jgi:hypothetical protein
MTALSKPAATIWVLATLALCVFPFAGVNEQFRLYYSNVMQTMTSLLAAAACFHAVVAFPRESPLRKVWAAIGAGVLSWGIGATIFAAYPLLNDGAETPYPFWSDVFYLATGPLMIAGLLLFKRAVGLETPLWGSMLALIVFFAASVVAFQANWEGVLDPDLVLRAVSIGYLAFDPLLMAVTVLTATAFRGGEVAKAWWWVVAGILLYFFANQAYTMLVLQETYATGHWIDVGWMLGFGCIAWAALKTRQLLD